jgi:stalled ribosome alternative rescue factor ArfA
MAACYNNTIIVEEVVVRNAYAKALANPLFRQRKIAARKGKGAYKRTEKHGNKQLVDF